MSTASRVGTTTRRLAEHVRTPIYREGYALVLSAALAAILGFVYWIVAARTYSADTVGLNSVAISTMMLVAGIAELNLMSALPRFVPGAGRSTWRLVGWSYGISIVGAVLVSVVFLAGVRKWAPSLASVASNDGFELWFIAATIVWCIFNIQDAVLTGLRRAIWVPVDNTLFGLVKIALLASFAALSPQWGIFASWTVGAVLCVLIINALLGARLIPEHIRRPPIDVHDVGGARQMGRFLAADYIGGMSWLLAITLIPIIVTQRFGAADNAYYSLAWVMAMPLYLVSASTASSLVVALVNERWRFGEYTQRVFVQTARLVVPTALVLALAAPLVLRLFGPEYVHAGTTPLRLLALSSIPSMVIALYMGVWRAEQRLSLLAWVRCVLYGAVVLVSVALLGPYGIRGPALAWLGVQAIAAVILVAVWPHVLLRQGSPIPWRLRGIRLVRNAAADTGVLVASGAIKRRPAVDRRRARAAVVVPSILAELAPNGEGPPPSAWTAQVLLASVTDRLVVLAGPSGGAPRAVVKLAESERAARGLARETEVLALLADDNRLGTWRALLPTVLATGEVDGEPYRVEGVLPGVDASRLLARGSPSVPGLARLAQAIEGLHRPTARELEVDRAVLAAWVDAPLEVLEFHARRRGGCERRQRRALDRLRDELQEALTGKRLTVGWTHGDYAPGNVLVDPATGAVSGIVDWELSATPNPQTIDVVQFVLAARALRRRREYGDVVLDALSGGWTDDERAVLARATEPLGSGPPLSALVLLAWLRHTQNLLTKADVYAENWLWRRLNFDIPLEALA